MIKVWAGGAEAGLVDRFAGRGGTFVYAAGVPPARAVSVTMPVRLASWNVSYGLPPIFEMSLPEGVLRERLRFAFAKATGRFDDLDLLGVVGRSQIGRLRYTGTRESLEEEVPFQSVDEILEQRRGKDLYRYLLDKFASSSGVSGVQPKILVRDEEASASLAAAKVRASPSFRGATHIVKFWEENEFPQLAANEYFCLRVAEKAGLETPRYRLAEDARALVVDRFDLRPDGTYRGFEDFCVLNARHTDEKYRGSYETAVLKRFGEFARSPDLVQDLERLFTLIVLNCALRNGDAHLKNFGIVYDDVLGAARLAPVYDVVTTAVYLPQDRMALTLNGRTNWPSARELQRLGETRAGLSPARVRAIRERIADAMGAVSKELLAHMREHADFAEIGARMLRHWDEGRTTSL
ncbi:MAG: type II toxin-antitoxin system HipA family toxin [Acidobacteria bacterium]|nr:MAG: type II toxin-antitoxin system HipA family toxin [Acidobacteriota bacterium]